MSGLGIAAARAALLGAVVAIAWACAPPGETNAPGTGEEARVEAALRHYSDLVLAMDHAGIAALFEPEGEMEREGGTPVHGRAAIERFLSGFSGYHVLENSTEPSSTIVRGDTAAQSGSYRQRVRTPDGKVVEASGAFHATWARASSGAWLIRTMGTTSKE